MQDGRDLFSSRSASSYVFARAYLLPAPPVCFPAALLVVVGRQTVDQQLVSGRTSRPSEQRTCVSSQDREHGTSPGRYRKRNVLPAY